MVKSELHKKIPFAFAFFFLLLILTLPLSILYVTNTNFPSSSCSWMEKQMADIDEVEGGESSKSERLVYVCSQTILRILVILTTLAATWIIVTAKQSVELFGITLDARYSYSPAFKFYALANAIACGFSLLSLFLVFVSNRRLRTRANCILFLLDLLMMALVVGGCAAASAIGYVGKYGNSHTGWLPICDQVGKYCHNVTTSLVLSYLGVLCLLLLIIISATKTKNQKI